MDCAYQKIESWNFPSYHSTGRVSDMNVETVDGVSHAELTQVVRL